MVVSLSYNNALSYFFFNLVQWWTKNIILHTVIFSESIHNQWLLSPYLYIRLPIYSNTGIAHVQSTLNNIVKYLDGFPQSIPHNIPEMKWLSILMMCSNVELYNVNILPRSIYMDLTKGSKVSFSWITKCRCT